MPTVKHRGCNIHYRVSGTGPLLILQHGFFGSHAEWKHFGYIDALKDSFTIATVDSLAHGESDKPTEMARYQDLERAGDMVAVMNGLNQDQAHLLGYSMGGWMAVAMAKHYPERLRSLSIGGWDCVAGLAPGLLQGSGKARLTWDEYITTAKELLPSDSLSWVTGDVETALSNCYEQLYELGGGSSAVAALDVPVLLYSGVEDAAHDPMRDFASDQGLDFLTLPGDHMSAMRDGASVLGPALKARLNNGALS